MNTRIISTLAPSLLGMVLPDGEYRVADISGGKTVHLAVTRTGRAGKDLYLHP